MSWYENRAPTVLPKDLGLWRNSAARWCQDVGTNGTADHTITFGATGDTPIVGDWDRDGDDDIGIHRSGSARIALDIGSNGTVDRDLFIGAANIDEVFVGDFDSDGFDDDLLIYRANIAKFYFDLDADGTVNRSHVLGASDIDEIHIGDFNGDGLDVVLIYSANQAKFFIDFGADGSVENSFLLGAINIDTVLVGDFDGDGNDDIAIHRASRATYFIDLRANGTVDRQHQFGRVDVDRALVGDVNRDNVDDIIVHRASDSRFLIDLDNDGTLNSTFLFGASTDFAIVGTWSGALLAAGGENQSGEPAATLTAERLAPVVDAAIDIWVGSGLTSDQLEQLRSVTYTVSDLPGGQLGAAVSSSIVIDTDAAGYGWFVDQTPHENEEFVDLGNQVLLTAGESAAAGRMDLLTVVLHELGHLLGHGHDADSSDVMNGWLATGVRRLPTEAEIALVSD